MTPHPLFGIRLKLQRAQEQLSELQATVESFRELKPYRFTSEYDANRRRLTLRAKFLRPLDGMWGVQIGEIVHNWRSALDHLVWELVIHHTGAPPTSNKTCFPIFETNGGYKGRSGPCIAGVSPTAAALIGSKQPFATGEGASSPLWQLYELSNFDKHRTLHLMGAFFEARKYELVGLAPAVPMKTDPKISGPFEDGTEFLVVEFGGTADPFSVPVEQVKMEGDLRIDIAFDDRCRPVANARVIPILGGIGRRVHETIEEIASKELGLTL
jgi:hypothetical protein